MYLWVVLTTFLALIAAYYLPIRADMHEQVSVPVAKAQVIQLISKQRAAMQYMVEHSWPYWCVAGRNCLTDSQARRKVNFTSGSLGDEALAAYLPKGFANSADYHPKLYCMKKEVSSGAYTLQSSCDRDLDDTTKVTERVVVTAGPIPERWQSYSDEEGIVRPSPDLIGAMRYYFTKKEAAGYAYDNGSDLIIVNYENTTTVVPKPIYNDNGTNTLKSCVDDNGTCLVYMSWR